jgi:hypothetical protein
MQSGREAIWIPAVTVHPGRDLWKCAELYFTLLGRYEEGGRSHKCIILGGRGVTKFSSLYLETT